MDTQELTRALTCTAEDINHSYLSPARLLSAPLPELLDETGVTLFDSSITDAAFFGAVVQASDGQIVLSMPRDRDKVERDTVARALLGQVFDVNLPALPDSFAMTDMAVAA
jgi:hypothetical protein